MRRKTIKILFACALLALSFVGCQKEFQDDTPTQQFLAEDGQVFHLRYAVNEQWFLTTLRYEEELSSLLHKVTQLVVEGNTVKLEPQTASIGSKML